MHVVLIQRPETITFKMKDGRVFQVQLIDGEAHLPNDLAQQMIDKGLVVAGTAPNPKPRWRMDGDVHGDLIPMYEPWVKEITPTQEKIS